MIDLLKNYFQLTNQDDERRRREKITGKVLTLDRGLEDILPYLFFLLGLAESTSPLQQMDWQIRRQRILEAIKRLLLRESRNQPLLIIFEDLHWLDNETQAFLQLLSESVATARILLLVNYRPEYQHAWSGKTYFLQLRLDPLGRAQAEEMLDALLANTVETLHATSLSDLKHFILDKTEGNPFFMEEIVQCKSWREKVPMPAKKYQVELTADEYQSLDQMLRRGTHGARKLLRARILLNAASGLSDEEIAQAVDTCVATIERTRRRFAARRLEALEELPWPGRSRLARHLL